MIFSRKALVDRWDIKSRGRWPWERMSPPQLFACSFLLLIALATLGLKTLPGLYTGDSLGWLDAFFTATSAVCVTGLIVKDTATFFTFWGQLYLLVFIQLGGLGMITFTSVIIVSLGRRLSLGQEAASVHREATPQIDSGMLIKHIFLYTISIEAIGAVFLYLNWMWHPDFGPVKAIWPSIFHSVSAFCNAGFSTFTNSLEGMQHWPLVLLTITGLVVAGGLGFLTLEEVRLYLQAKREQKPFRISLHSRMVMAMTLLLVVGAWPVFAILEWSNQSTFYQMSFLDKITNSLFLSVTPRTAGFNTIDYSVATEPTCFLTILLMIVGGSPGSTAGGIKTTTFAILGVVALSRLRGEIVTTLWNRSFRDETINRTVGLIVVALAMVVFGILALTLTEHDPEGRDHFLNHCFEIASAFNTVGLTMGLTPTLSFASKILLIVLMFLGRVGPLTFASALAVRYARATKFRYAYEDVVVG